MRVSQDASQYGKLFSWFFFPEFSERGKHLNQKTGKAYGTHQWDIILELTNWTLSNSLRSWIDRKEDGKKRILCLVYLSWDIDLFSSNFLFSCLPAHHEVYINDSLAIWTVLLDLPGSQDYLASKIVLYYNYLDMAVKIFFYESILLDCFSGEFCLKWLCLSLVRKIFWNESLCTHI